MSHSRVTVYRFVERDNILHSFRGLPTPSKVDGQIEDLLNDYHYLLSGM